MTSISKSGCAVDGCTRSRGPTQYCHMHYWRLNKRGDIGSVTPERHQHGFKGTTEYEIWVGMRQRCNNPNDNAYMNYGGRGITVCPRWGLFMNFYEDMGPRPKGMSLDRIDPDGGYAPDNCRWASATVQSHNKRRSGRNSSGYRGVCKVRYSAEIGYEGKSWRIGSFDTAEEAAWMYDQWALCLYGETAQLNFEYFAI